jgi:hypothetical protein
MQVVQESDEAFKFAGIAECLNMCPEEEVYNRCHVESGVLSPFEQNAVGEHLTDLLVKRFSRSAADKEKKIPSQIRPPIIIFHTIEYLRECIADQDRYPAGKSFYKYITG